MDQVADGALVRGERLFLRPVAGPDVGPGYVRWMNDPEVVRFTESRFSGHSEQDLRAYVEKMENDPRSHFLAIVENGSGRHVGNLKIGPVDERHGTASVGIILGEKDCWGKGYATEALTLSARLAFETLKLHKLTAGCVDLNAGAIRAFEKAGFMRECVRGQHNLFEGEYRDVVVLCLFHKHGEAP